MDDDANRPPKKQRRAFMAMEEDENPDSPGTLPESRGSPGFSRDSPGLSRGSPGFSRDSPGLSRGSPGFSMDSSGFSRCSPGFPQDFSASSQDFPEESPGMETGACGSSDPGRPQIPELLQPFIPSEIVGSFPEQKEEMTTKKKKKFSYSIGKSPRGPATDGNNPDRPSTSQNVFSSSASTSQNVFSSSAMESMYPFSMAANALPYPCNVQMFQSLASEMRHLYPSTSEGINPSLHHQQQQQQQQQQQSSYKPKRSDKHCSFCRNHSIEQPLKGHKPNCQFRKCPCPSCQITRNKQAALRKSDD